MTYEEIVAAVRHTYENADARAIWNHIAVQVNVTGEGAGAFYIEVAERAVCVEPYDYYDRDGLITVPGPVIMAIAKGETSFKDEYEKGTIRLDGDMSKFCELSKIKLNVVAEDEKKETEKKEANPKTVAKKVVAKKETVKKEASKKETTKKETIKKK